jgi:DNA transformation protein and related proteins
MAVSDSFLTFVLEQLGEVPAVTSKRMFGGVGLYSDETFFAALDNDTMFFKVDDVTSARYIARKMPPFTPIPGQPPMMGYRQVPADVLEDASALAEWSKEAIGVGRRAPKKKKKKKKRSASATAAVR